MPKTSTATSPLQAPPRIRCASLVPAVRLYPGQNKLEVERTGLLTRYVSSVSTPPSNPNRS